MTNLSVTYLGLELKNPIIAGSSGLTNSIENLKALEEAGVAAVVFKINFRRGNLSGICARVQKTWPNG